MRKFLWLLLCICFLLTGNIILVNASDIGNVVNQTVYTDIIASINDYNIRSFNIDNYTAIIAEDLINYGFVVNWDEKERELTIKRGYNNEVPSTYIAPKISEDLIGKKAYDVLSTDIKTYINGNLVKSFNIGGNTIIYFDDLSVFGDVSYDDSARRLDLDVSDGLNYKIALPVDIDFSNSDAPTLYFEINQADGIQVRWMARNNTNKTVNYYTTHYAMINRIGDLAYDSTGKSTFSIKMVGPKTPGSNLANFTGMYDGEAYDAPCTKIMLYAIDLEYSDGTSETIYYNQFGPEVNLKNLLEPLW